MQMSFGTLELAGEVVQGSLQSWQPFQVIRHSLQDMPGMCLGSTAVTQDLATKPACLTAKGTFHDIPGLDN